jgi:hypothetical protein
MSEEEAARAGVENHKAFFRVENGKSSMSAAPEKADWFQTISVELGNSDEFGNSDNVGVVTTWEWPDAFEGVTVKDLRAAQTEIAKGRWRASSQAKDWAGHAIAKAIALDTTSKAPKAAKAKARMNRAKIAEMLKTWIGNGMFVEVEGLDDRREKRKFIEVGKPADDDD